MASSTAEFAAHGVASAAIYTTQLARCGRRLRLVAVLRRGVRALWIAALFYVAFSFLGSLIVPQLPVFLAGLALAVGLFLVLLVPVVARRLSPLEIARAYDARLNLSERLATAVEVLARAAESPFRSVLLYDAWRHAQEIRPREAYPLRVPRWDVLLLLVALVALFLWEVFPYMAGRLAPLAPLAHQVAAVREGTLLEGQTPDAFVVGEDEQSVADGKDLTQPAAAEDVQQQAQDQPLLTQADLAQQQNLAQQGEAGAEGEAGEGEEAEASLSDLAQDLQDSRNPHVDQQAATLSEVGRELAEARPSRQAGQSLERGNYEQAAQQFEDLAQNVRDLSREDRNDLTDAFANAAESAEAVDPRLAQELADVSREIASYNDRAAERELQELGDAIQERGQRIQAQQQLEEQAEQLSAGAGGESGSRQDDAQTRMARAQQAFNTTGTMEQSEAALQQDSWQLQSAPGGPSQGGGERGEESFQPGPEAPRLQIEQKPSVVLADRGVGPSQWSPQRAPVFVPGPGTAPAQYGVTDAGNAIVSTGGASHFVPWMVADYVQKYFNALSTALEQSP